MDNSKCSASLAVNSPYCRTAALGCVWPCLVLKHIDQLESNPVLEMTSVGCDSRPPWVEPQTLTVSRSTNLWSNSMKAKTLILVAPKGGCPYSSTSLLFTVNEKTTARVPPRRNAVPESSSHSVHALRAESPAQNLVATFYL